MFLLGLQEAGCAEAHHVGSRCDNSPALGGPAAPTRSSVWSGTRQLCSPA